MDIANQPLLGKRNALREVLAQRLDLLFSFRYGYRLYARSMNTAMAARVTLFSGQ